MINVAAGVIAPVHIIFSRKLRLTPRCDHEGHVRIRQNTAVARDQVDELIGCEDGSEALES